MKQRINQQAIDSLFVEVLELRRANGILLARLHQCKRRNREDKVKLRNTIHKCKKEYYELIVQLTAKY